MMTRAEIFKELNTLSKRIFALDQKLSQYIESQQEKTDESLSETKSAIVDLEIGLAEIASQVEEVAE